METMCSHCEYGNRFIDLGRCPECSNGRIVGDLFTRGIFCSNLHLITAVAVDFCKPQSCMSAMQKYYEVVLLLPLNKEQMIALGKYLNKTPAQIYLTTKKSEPLSEKFSFKEMLLLGKYLTENQVPFKIIPDFPVLPKLCECFPHMANDYEWFFEKF